MLKKEKKITHTTACLSNCEYVFIARPCDPGNGNTRVVMTYISQEEERKLEENKVLIVTRGSFSFTIDPDFCYVYGTVDFSPNSKDIEKLDSYRYFDKLTVRQFIPSEYDYETHTVTSDRKGGRWFDTACCKTYLPFLYGCLNKPERTVIFKEYTDTKALLKARKHNEKNRTYYEKNKKEIRSRTNSIKRANRISKMVFNFKPKRK